MTDPLPAMIIFDQSEITEFVEAYRKLGKKIVLTQGSFDLVHIGHARYCQAAKEYGDVLIVGVDSDEKIKQRKGPDRPVVPEAERMEILSYLKPVDLVVLKKVKEPKWRLIKLVKPDVLVATRETYTQEQIDKLEKFCGKVVVLDPMATTSTSAKIRLMQLGTAQKISARLSKKLIATIEEVLSELKGES